MHLLDWAVLAVTLLSIVIYGIWKTKGSQNVTDYILAGKETSWFTVGVSVMATQASAITFLSTPGQGFADGLGFVQFYFGLPLAMIIICHSFIPIYHKLKVHTAYEYLEQRFDHKTRLLTAILFLIQRGLGTAITIYAPSIILSTILGWNLTNIVLIIGILVILYTFSGGTKAVNVTQKQQMFIIFLGMFLSFFLILKGLPEEVTFSNALKIAGTNCRMNLLDFSIKPESRYTFWSGITGGLFLALSYFGTDQSQVQRYLSGKSIKESQKGLIMNGLLKVPMQFFILLTGVMVFVFFQFVSTPINFNPNSKTIIANSAQAKEYHILENELNVIIKNKKTTSIAYAKKLNQNQEDLILKNQLQNLNEKEKSVRDKAKDLIAKAEHSEKTSDADYVFIHYIIHYLPKGVVGLLLAVILCAAMSATASGLSALASTSLIDLYRPSLKTEKSEEHFIKATRLFTLLWGIVAIAFACLANLFENLIQMVNIIGSIFYGTVLGIFLVGFYLKKINANSVFISAVISQTAIFIIYYFAIHIYPSGQEKLGYLWLNFIGAAMTVVLALIFHLFNKEND